MQRHGTVSDLPEEKHRSTRRFLQSQMQLVFSHLRLECLAQCVLRAKETVRRHQPIDALVRAKVVVVAEVVLHPLATLRQVLRSCAVPQLLTDRLPQPLALSQRLRVVGA